MVYKILRFPIQIIVTLFLVVALPIFVIAGFVLNGNYKDFKHEFDYMVVDMFKDIWK